MEQQLEKKTKEMSAYPTIDYGPPLSSTEASLTFLGGQPTSMGEASQPDKKRIQQNTDTEKNHWAVSMTRWVQVLETKPDNSSSIS